MAWRGVAQPGQWVQPERRPTLPVRGAVTMPCPDAMELSKSHLGQTSDRQLAGRISLDCLCQAHTSPLPLPCIGAPQHATFQTSDLYSRLECRLGHAGSSRVKIVAPLRKCLWLKSSALLDDKYHTRLSRSTDGFHWFQLVLMRSEFRDLLPQILWSAFHDSTGIPQAKALAAGSRAHNHRIPSHFYFPLRKLSLSHFELRIVNRGTVR